MAASIKAALRAAHGREFVQNDLSMFYLTLEVSQVVRGMDIAIPEKYWEIFRTMTVAEYAETMVELASRMDVNKYTKSKRNPTKNPTKKISGHKLKHVSTARLLARRP